MLDDIVVVLNTESVLGRSVSFGYPRFILAFGVCNQSDADVPLTKIALVCVILSCVG